MVSSLVLRRKLQKKKKHKPYRKCPQCGKRLDMTLMEDDRHNWRLVKHCGGYMTVASCLNKLELVKGATGCGYNKELYWTGEY